MKMKGLLMILFIGLSLASVSLSGCSFGGNVGPVGGGAYVG